jgi:segregation and condensation protein B
LHKKDATAPLQSYSYPAFGKFSHLNPRLKLHNPAQNSIEPVELKTLPNTKVSCSKSYLCWPMEAQLNKHIEALIFSAPTPIGIEDIRAALAEAFEQEVTTETVEAGINHLFEQYKSDLYSFEPAEIAGGYQFLTKGAYHNTIAVHLKLTTKKRLSQPAMETLALIAYKQPVTKSEMEQLRGVSCDYAIQKLLEKELVHISGRSEGPGKPLLYSTSEKFMEYLGIRSMDDLPKPKDFKELENMVGESSDLSDMLMPISTDLAASIADEVESEHMPISDDVEPEIIALPSDEGEIGPITEAEELEIEDMVINELKEGGALDQSEPEQSEE